MDRWMHAHLAFFQGRQAEREGGREGLIMLVWLISQWVCILESKESMECGLVRLLIFWSKVKRAGWTELTSLTIHWKLFGIHRFWKLQAQQGVRFPDGKWAVGSSRATETGKLHFAQSHTFSTDPNYYFHTSHVIWWGGSVGWDKRCLELGGWAEKAQTCLYC